MADHNLVDKAHLARRVADDLDNQAKRLSELDGSVDHAIREQLFPTIEGNTANRLNELYTGWDGDLLKSAAKLRQAAQLLRQDARFYLRSYDEQVKEDRERERNKLEMEQKAAGDLKPR
ncbi:MAG TPA: hypothetical protein VH186_22110 [Chloroflexia bacterium]|nr:hypothetical protein [Chloroflexia bacterium]